MKPHFILLIFQDTTIHEEKVTTLFCFFINTADSYGSHEDLAQEIARQLQSVVSAQVIFTEMYETACVCIYYYEWLLFKFLMGLMIIVLCKAIAELYKLKVVFSASKYLFNAAHTCIYFTSHHCTTV